MEICHYIFGYTDELAFLTGAEEKIPQQESCLSTEGQENDLHYHLQDLEFQLGLFPW